MSGLQRRARRRATQVLRASSASARALLPDHAREPRRRRASARSPAMQQVLTALGKDAVAFMAADEFPLPYEYRFIQLEGLATEPPADLDERTLVFLDCGNIDRTPADALKRDGRAHPQHRPPPRQHALRDDQPRRPARVVHGRDGLGPDARPRRASRRGRSPRRSTSAWSPTPAASCTRTPGRARTRWRPS